MKTRILQQTVCILLATLFFTLSGCSPYGYIFHHTTRPLDSNMNRTPAMANNSPEGDIKHFSYNVIDIRVGKNGIGDIAREYGLTEIYFADIETLRILGIWEQEFVHVYGR